MPSTCQDTTAVSVEQDQTAKIIQHDLLSSGYPDKKKQKNTVELWYFVSQRGHLVYLTPSQTRNFSFSHSVFYPFEELSTIFIKFEIVVSKLFQFGRV